MAKFVLYSERKPTELKRWYIFRQKNNTRSASVWWYEHIADCIETLRGLALPEDQIEWLNEDDNTEAA